MSIAATTRSELRREIREERKKSDTVDLANIAVAFISEKNMKGAIDPVSLEIQKDIILRNNPQYTDVSFVLEKEIEATEKKTQCRTGYYYLSIVDGRVKERYIFSPFQFEHFKKKKACESLWHGCEKPSVDAIIAYAKNLKINERKKGK